MSNSEEARNTDYAAMCKDFVQEYCRISNTRPDYLYRLFQLNSTVSVSETVRGKKKTLRACAANQQEIRYLLGCILDRVHLEPISLNYQVSKSGELELIVNGIFEPKDSRQDHFFAQTFTLTDLRNRCLISYSALQIFSHNQRQYLLNKLEGQLNNSKLSTTINYPPVINTKIQSRVCRSEGTTSPSPSSLDEGAAFTSPCCCPPEINDMKLPRALLSKPRIETDTAKAAASEGFRTQGWDAFCKDKPGEAFADVMEASAKGKTVFGLSGKKSSVDVCFNCFGELSKNENGFEFDDPWNAASKAKRSNTGAYLRIFGFEPIPDGPPVEWELSHDAVLTQMRTYQEVVDRCRIVPKRRRSTRSTVDWHKRTVFLNELPRDVHPDSLRRAFETMFGEIEDENGILIASAQQSSIAYVVFKSLQAAKAVGLADAWVKGTKIIIQKYRSPFVDFESME